MKTAVLITRDALLLQKNYMQFMHHLEYLDDMNSYKKHLFRSEMALLQIRKLLWVYCPGHAGVSGNEREDKLASTADFTSGRQRGRAEVFRGLRNFLNMDSPEHHSIDRLKERGVENGNGPHSTLKGRERSVFNQANIGTVSRATLGRLLKDGQERVWAFPSVTMPS